MKTYKTHIINIVEDQILIGKSLQNYINENSNYACTHHYFDARSCVEGITNNFPHVIICDIGLPDFNGVEFMESVLKIHPEIIFIMFTVFDSDEMLFTALRKGAMGYLLKDDPFPIVVKAIEDVLNGGGAMSPTIANKVISSFKVPYRELVVEVLTEHQTKILDYISQGLLNKEIADKLGITEGTVKIQISSIYKKLQVNNRVEAVNYYNKNIS